MFCGDGCFAGQKEWKAWGLVVHLYTAGDFQLPRRATSDGTVLNYGGKHYSAADE